MQAKHVQARAKKQGQRPKMLALFVCVVYSSRFTKPKLKETQPNMGDPNTGEIYQDFIRKPDDIGMDSNTAARLRELETGQRIQELQHMVAEREAAKPDLRTFDGALHFLDYHAPNDDTLPRHQRVNAAFRQLLVDTWSALPDGPGKTVAIRALNRARMECNSCIANGGQ